MEKYLLNLIILSVLIASTASVKTVVNNDVSGSNSSVHTEINTTVNGKTTKVVSDKQGEIKVEVKDEGNGSVAQTTASEAPTNTPAIIKKEIDKSIKTINVKTPESKGIFLFINNFMKRFLNVFRFTS